MCTANVSIVTEKYTLAFRSSYDFRTVFKLLHYCSVDFNCCIKTCEYFIPTIKENCQTGNYGKFGKKLLLQNDVPFSLISFEPGKLCPGVGILFPFFDPGPEFCTEKLSPGREF